MSMSTKLFLSVKYNGNYLSLILLVWQTTFNLTWEMRKDGLVAIAADVERAIDFGNIVTETGRNHRRREEVDLGPGNRFRRPELQRARAVRRRRGRCRRKFGTALHRQNALVEVRVVPHERRLEVVVVAVPMHGAQWRHAKQEAGQRIQQVVVEQQRLQPPAKRHRVWQRFVLQLVARQRQILEVEHTTDVGRNVV